MPQSHASETIFHADAKEAIIAVNHLLAIVAKIAVVALDAVEALEAKFAFVAKRAIRTVSAVKNAGVIVTVFGLKTREGHVTILAFFGVLAIMTVFILHDLEPGTRNLEL